MAVASTSNSRELFVGVQLGPYSIYDEEAERCLDLLQQRKG